MKKIFYTCFIFLLFTLLITFPNIVSKGCINGINIVLYSLIPALFPFIILTTFLIENNLCDYICVIFYPFLSKVFPASKKGIFAIIIGFLCGYPMGAKTVVDLYKREKIDYNEASYLLMFTNNCSISFLFNFVLYTCLSKEKLFINNIQITKPIIFILIYLPPVIVGIINGLFYRNFLKTFGTNFSPSDKVTNTNYKKNKSIISSSIIPLLNLSVYVIVFSIIIEFLINFGFKYNILLASIFEITTGIKYISTTIVNNGLKIFVILFLCSWGGISITMQTFSVLPSKKLMVMYVLGKFETIIIFCILFYFLFYIL